MVIPVPDLHVQSSDISLNLDWILSAFESYPISLNSITYWTTQETIFEGFGERGGGSSALLHPISWGTHLAQGLFLPVILTRVSTDFD